MKQFSANPCNKDKIDDAKEATKAIEKSLDGTVFLRGGRALSLS